MRQILILFSQFRSFDKNCSAPAVSCAA